MGRWPVGNRALTRSEITARWRKNNPEKERAADIKHRFGISVEEYDAARAEPCAVPGCGKPSAVLDHDHETGVIREGLCHGHNTALGKFGDDPDLLRWAADYIEKYKQKQENSNVF